VPLPSTLAELRKGSHNLVRDISQGPASYGCTLAGSVPPMLPRLRELAGRDAPQSSQPKTPATPTTSSPPLRTSSKPDERRGLSPGLVRRGGR
jgi:hypothetical protein